jgi:hypothetical protein
MSSVTEQTQTALTPNGDTSHGFAQESTPGEGVREFYRQQGKAQAAERVKAQICFDALEDDDHRC